MDWVSEKLHRFDDVCTVYIIFDAGGNDPDNPFLAFCNAKFGKLFGKAKIQIHLFNGGSDAFRFDVYGKEIIVERSNYAHQAFSMLKISGTRGVEPKEGGMYCI